MYELFTKIIKLIYVNDLLFEIFWNIDIIPSILLIFLKDIGVIVQNNSNELSWLKAEKFGNIWPNSEIPTVSILKILTLCYQQCKSQMQLFEVTSNIWYFGHLHKVSILSLHSSNNPQ